MSKEIFWEIQKTLGWEFDKYIMAHPEIKIPNNAQIVFQLKDSPEFNKWILEIARSQHEPNQPVLLVEVEDLAPPPPLESRLINPHIEITTSI